MHVTAFHACPNARMKGWMRATPREDYLGNDGCSRARESRGVPVFTANHGSRLDLEAAVGSRDSGAGKDRKHCCHWRDVDRQHLFDFDLFADTAPNTARRVEFINRHLPRVEGPGILYYR